MSYGKASVRRKNVQHLLARASDACVGRLWQCFWGDVRVVRASPLVLLESGVAFRPSGTGRSSRCWNHTSFSRR